jgi:hypothetical protein
MNDQLMPANNIADYVGSLAEEFPILKNKNELQNSIQENISRMHNHFVHLNSNERILHSEYFLCSDGIPVLVHVYDNHFLIYGTVYYTLIASKKHGSSELILNEENFHGYSPKFAEIEAKLGQIQFPLAEATKPNVYKFGQSANLGHYIWNELTGLEMLFRTGLIHNFDWIEVGDFDYFSVQKFLERQGFRVFKNEQSTKQALFFKTANIFLSKNCRDWILDEILEMNRFRQSDLRMKIVVQIRTGTRAWQNSPEEIADLINKIGNRFTDCKFIIDGFSKIENSKDSESQAISYDLDFANAIMEHISSVNVIETTIGKSFSDKLMAIHGAQLVIGPIGSGGVLSNWLLNVAGICFGPESYYSWTQHDSDYLVWKPRNKMQYYPVDRITLDQNGNYSIDMGHLYKIVVETICQENISSKTT